MNRKTRITSIKPGRGPSFMGGIGSIAAIIFGIFWTGMAFQMTRHSPFGGVGALFPLFGIVFVLLGAANAVYNFRNATAEKRYSMLDITDSETEPDPLNERFGASDGPSLPAEDPGEEHHDGAPGNRFCPYCGEEARPGFRFCPSCGRELPS